MDTPPSSVRAFAVVAAGYWTAPGYRGVAWMLTAGLATTVAGNVGIALWLNIWNRDFFNALQNKDLQMLFSLLWVLAAIVGSAGVGVAIQLHLKRRLQFNWRSWLSRVTVHRWLHSGRQYQLGLLADEVDNPDGRIAEDIRVSTEYAVEFAASILQCVLQLITFPASCGRCPARCRLRSAAPPSTCRATWCGAPWPTRWSARFSPTASAAA